MPVIGLLAIRAAMLIPKEMAVCRSRKSTWQCQKIKKTTGEI
jgi:hypothetical protein